MEKNKEKELEAFIKKSVEDAGLEEPSVDFTASVASKINAVSGQSSITSYRPLISRPVWGLLAASFIGVFTYIISGSTKLQATWFSFYPLDEFLESGFLERIPNLSISDTFVYAVIGLAFFTAIQVFLLKHYFEERLRF